MDFLHLEIWRRLDFLEYSHRELLPEMFSGALNSFLKVEDILPARGDLLLIQKKNFALLKSLDKICRDNHIPYWIQGGALVGALRTGTFVPWDDDVDIGMMREDLQRLQKILEKNTKFKIDIAYHLKDLGCIMPKFMEKDSRSHNFIDIFSHDFVSIKKEGATEFWEDFCKKRAELEREYKSFPIPYCFKNKIPTEVQNKVDALMAEYLARLPLSPNGEYICFGIENLTQHHQYVFPKDWIFPLKEIVLTCADKVGSFPSPHKSWDYCHNQYGDLSRIPVGVGCRRNSRYSHEELVYLINGENENGNKL